MINLCSELYHSSIPLLNKHVRALRSIFYKKQVCSNVEKHFLTPCPVSSFLSEAGRESAPSVSYLFRQEHSFVIYWLFWPIWKENVVASSISHFTRISNVDDAHTLWHRIVSPERKVWQRRNERSSSSWSSSILKHESLTPNLQFISVKIS